MTRTIAHKAAWVGLLGFALGACDKSGKGLHGPAEFDPSSNISMTKAVEIAEAQFPGGWAVAAELDPEEIGYEYEVIVFHEGKFWEVEIDTADGRIKEVEREWPSEGDIEMYEDDDVDAAENVEQDLGGQTGTEDQFTPNP